MSRLAEQYVLGIGRGRITGKQRLFLLVLAFHHQNGRPTYWPSHDTLASEMDTDVREVRRMVAELELAKMIHFDSGQGRGRRGSYLFLELPVEVKEGLKEGGKQEIKEEKTVPPNKVLQDQKLQVQKQHGSAALIFWIRLKHTLQTELPEEEWKLWVRPTYLLRETHGHLLLALPVGRQIANAFHSRREWLRAKMQAHGYTCSATTYPDGYTLARMQQEYPEQFENLAPGVKKRVQGVAS